jgi:SAM-dependent methyltransferase
VVDRHMTITPLSPALDAYDALAPSYDRFTEAYDHEGWLARIEAIARAEGLRPGARVLDVACGTGKSTAPLVARGYAVEACDLSAAMVARARRRLGPGVDVFVADMRALDPARGPFALITCLDDAVNYLADDADLAAAFAAARALLAPGGLYVFDVNTIGCYDQAFCGQFVVETADALFCWQGERPPEVAAEGRFRSRLDAFAREPDGRWDRTTTVHEQRHFGPEVVSAALGRAGLEVVRVLGQAATAELRPQADERSDFKRLTVARRAA